MSIGCIEKLKKFHLISLFMNGESLTSTISFCLLNSSIFSPIASFTAVSYIPNIYHGILHYFWKLSIQTPSKNLKN